MAGWVEAQLQTVGGVAGRDGVTADEVKRVLADVGHRLYDNLLPEWLRQLVWTLRERGVRSMLVLSDEPHIPWELIKPYTADSSTSYVEKEDDFWGESFALTRWLRGRPPARQLGLDRVYAVAVCGGQAKTRDMVLSPGATAASEPPVHSPGVVLEGATEEIDLLRSLGADRTTFVLLPPRVTHLREALERGGFDVLHLASHGSFGGPTAAERSALFLEDGPFAASMLSPRMAGPLRQERL